MGVLALHVLVLMGLTTDAEVQVPHWANFMQCHSVYQSSAHELDSLSRS